MKTKRKTYVIDAFTVHQIREGRASMSEVARVIGCTPQTISNHVKSGSKDKPQPAAKDSSRKPTRSPRSNAKWRHAYSVINKCLKKGQTMAQAADEAGVSLSYAYAIKKMDEQASA